MDKSMKSDPTDIEVVVNVDPAKEGADKTVVGSLNEVNPGVADGNADSEETESSESIEDSAVAPADAASESDEEVEVVPEEAVSLSVVNLEFEDKEVISFDLDTDLQLVLRKVCNDQGARPVSFEVEGDISPQEFQLLRNVIK